MRATRSRRKRGRAERKGGSRRNVATSIDFEDGIARNIIVFNDFVDLKRLPFFQCSCILACTRGSFFANSIKDLKGLLYCSNIVNSQYGTSSALDACKTCGYCAVVSPLGTGLAGDLAYKALS